MMTETVHAVIFQVGVEVDSQLSRLVQGAVELVVGHPGDVFVRQNVAARVCF